MHSRLSIVLWLLTCSCLLAQQQESKLMNRIMKAPDQSQRNPLNDKSFNGGGTLDLSKKGASQNTFVFEQKLKPQDYTTRSFFGIKNPWFGKKVHDANQANLWSKTIVENADRKYAVDNLKVSEFYQTSKKASTGNEIMPTPTFIPKSGTPGAMDQINDQLKKKNMTIDQVRDLLNKN